MHGVVVQIMAEDKLAVYTLCYGVYMSEWPLARSHTCTHTHTHTHTPFHSIPFCSLASFGMWGGVGLLHATKIGCEQLPSSLVCLTVYKSLVIRSIHLSSVPPLGLTFPVSLLQRTWRWIQHLSILITCPSHWSLRCFSCSSIGTLLTLLKRLSFLILSHLVTPRMSCRHFM